MKQIPLILAVAGATVLMSPLAAQAPGETLSQATPAAPALPADPATVLGFGSDVHARMTVKVSIEGRGPYDFVVDTGAERTVIARELADDLSLGAGKRARMHSMTEVSEVGTVLINALEVGGKKVRDIHAPALARRDLGAEGMLGVDSLKSQRVSFDFVRRQMTVVPSSRREEHWDKGAIVVSGKRRFGQLILADAEVDGQRVWVIIDTGSQVTVGNTMLRRKLEAKQRLGATTPIEMTSVTGGTIIADRATARTLRIGGMDIKAMPIAFADVHPFRKLDLMDRPALLLGMDALQLFDRLSVDFAKRRVRMLSPASSERSSDQQLAAVTPAAVASD